MELCGADYSCQPRKLSCPIQLTTHNFSVKAFVVMYDCVHILGV